jgi:hypothetical protein
VVRHVAPSKPAGPYLITAAPDWWQLDDATSWKEPLFGGEYGPIWVSPMPANEVAARLEMRVQSAGGSRYTVGELHVFWRVVKRQSHGRSTVLMTLPQSS